MRQVLLGLVGLTMTCARPAPLPVAHARPPVPVAAGKPQAVSAPTSPKKAPHTAALVAGPLTNFFGALTELREQRRERHVRVFWLGDSHTNADFLSGAVRSALGESFGHGGPGFVRIGAKPYRHDGVKVSRGGSWNIDPDPPARRSLQDDGVFGLAGTRAVPGADATFSAQVTTRDGASDPASFELSYSLLGNASFLFELGGRTRRVDAKTPADMSTSGIAHLTLEAPLKSSLVLSPLSGAPRFFGLVIERRGAPGIVVDTAGIDGARLETPLAWDEAAFVDELARRAPELVVIAFGTNEAFDALKVERYATQLSALVQRTRKGAPRASCLVLGPTDAPLGDGSVPRVAEVAKVLQASATQLRCSFVSLQELMGGEGSFAKGMKAKERLAQADKLHLTPRGYQELGVALAQQLLDAYSAGRTDLP